MKLTAHQINALNRKIQILRADERTYLITLLGPFEVTGPLVFHRGKIDEGANGLTLEVLLAIMIDKLQLHQAGPEPCPQNQTALGACMAALSALQDRARQREAQPG